MTDAPPPDRAAGETTGPGRGPAPDVPEDAQVVVQALADESPGRVAATIAALERGLRGLCWFAGATAVAAAGLSLSASRQPAALAVVAAVALATIASAALVAHRIRLLGRAIANPKEVVVEARRLATRLTDSPQLRSLAGMVRRRSGAPGGRVRRALRVGRTTSAVIGLAGPDPASEPHLAAVAPTRLRGLWLGTVVGLVGWALCGLIAFSAALALIAQAIT